MHCSSRARVLWRKHSTGGDWAPGAGGVRQERPDQPAACVRRIACSITSLALASTSPLKHGMRAHGAAGKSIRRGWRPAR